MTPKNPDVRHWAAVLRLARLVAALQRVDPDLTPDRASTLARTACRVLRVPLPREPLPPRARLSRRESALAEAAAFGQKVVKGPSDRQ